MNALSRVLISAVLLLCATGAHAEDAFHGEISAIPENIRRQMTGTTWEKDCPVSLDQLSYLRVSYWGFDDAPHVGELIVNGAIARNTVAAFKELFEMRFPIESMKLPSYYANHPDDASAANNTSAFCYRKDAQSPGKLSLHSYGIAVDLNPFYNPAPVAGGKVEPEGAEMYLDRSVKHKGMIREGDKVFRIMAKHGWAWGGFFRQGVDPMHFEKIINRQYIIDSLEYCPNVWGLDSAL